MSFFSTPLTTADGQDQEAQPANRGKWEMNLGPLCVGSHGLGVKPQMKVGGKMGGFKADFGVGDVRDGLSFQAKAEVGMNVQSSGTSLAELHNGIRCSTPGFREALEIAKSITVRGANGFRTNVCDALGISLDKLDLALAGHRVSRPMRLKVSADVGVGGSLKVCLGWCDTKGYNMVGIGGGAKALVGLRANIFAGRHHTGESAKVILGIGNFTFEYTFPLPTSAAVEEHLAQVEAGAEEPAHQQVLDASGEVEDAEEAEEVEKVGENHDEGVDERRAHAGA